MRDPGPADAATPTGRPGTPEPTASPPGGTPVTDARQARYDRVEAALAWPMLGVSLTYVAVLLAPEVVSLPDPAQAALTALDALTWLAFLVELAVLFVLAPSKRRMLRGHWMNVVIVAVPFLRPLRLLRVMQVLASVAILARSVTAFRSILSRRGLQAFFAVSLVVIFVSATLTWLAERHRGDSPLDQFTESAWWSLTAAAGNNNVEPVTTAGRFFEIVLLLVGVSLFGVVTASIAAYFVEEDQRQERADLRSVAERLERLEALLERSPGAVAGTAPGNGTGPGGGADLAERLDRIEALLRAGRQGSESNGSAPPDAAPDADDPTPTATPGTTS